MTGRELYTEVNGQKEDAHLHDEMLSSTEANEATAVDAVKRAMHEDGMSKDDALALYGTSDTARRMAKD